MARSGCTEDIEASSKLLATASLAVTSGTTSISSSCVLNTKSIPTPFADRPPPLNFGLADLISIRFSYILPSAPMKTLTLAAVLPAALNPTRLMLNILNENFSIVRFSEFQNRRRSLVFFPLDSSAAEIPRERETRSVDGLALMEDGEE
jgi:hypothetical protein